MGWAQTALELRKPKNKEGWSRQARLPGGVGLDDKI